MALMGIPCLVAARNVSQSWRLASMTELMGWGQRWQQWRRERSWLRKRWVVGIMQGNGEGPYVEDQTEENFEFLQASFCQELADREDVGAWEGIIQ
eukprot:9985943-Ditylum_brightwellii.AAC.1